MRSRRRGSCREIRLLVTGSSDSSELLTEAKEERKAVVTRILAEWDERPRMSLQEIRKMRDEGRY